MKKLAKQNKILIIVFSLLTIISIIFRFYNLDWGSPFYFHPDERNIASGVTRLHFPENLNPEFFAYGSLPIYTTYALGIVENLTEKISDPTIDVFVVRFENAIILLRLTSAFLSVGILILIFNLIYKKLGLEFAVIGTLLSGFNVGLLQYSHFGTFEMWLTFLFVLLLKLLYELVDRSANTRIIFIGIVTGLLISVKVSSVIVLPIVLLSIFLSLFRKKKDFKDHKNYINLILLFVLCINMAVLTVIFTSPFFFLDFESFWSSMQYESAVALGSLKVFYTGGFLDTTPVLYQLRYVYPFIINPLNLAFLIFSIPFIIRRVVRRDKLILFVTIFFVAIFISQAFFYVKWVRYYIPTIPFLIILLTFGLNDILEKLKNKKLISPVAFFAIIIISILFSFAYFKTVLFQKDSRVEAYEFAKGNIFNNPQMFSEVYDMGIVPFNSSFSNITLFDFYALDSEWESSMKSKELDDLIINSDYFISPSQRVIRNRTLKPTIFPRGHLFYTTLEEKGINLIYETPCDIFCKVLYIGDPIYSVEETANVFDRPIFRIYKINE